MPRSSALCRINDVDRGLAEQAHCRRRGGCDQPRSRIGPSFRDHVVHRFFPAIPAATARQRYRVQRRRDCSICGQAVIDRCNSAKRRGSHGCWRMTGYSRWRISALRIPQERLWRDRARTPTETACLQLYLRQTLECACRRAVAGDVDGRRSAPRRHLDRRYVAATNDCLGLLAALHARERTEKR